MFYLKTFVLNKFFDSVNDIQLTLIIKISKIPGMHEALFIYCKLCCLRIVQIA
ncbi:hypothetical protein HanXRQr2_Chr02g0081911 [Helianthus annuus]|uniref:Uncharacterized protein n=1 Tax=Helianthus annuus TaxID=4232 RepID=A0A9K3JSH9_HELAN|nr:hypothetical protein HanXRQr2_Chr02g0081911 [Helianthus annuus]KAJ0953030.1 hypothetical protein HanPSC8_Chr02g0079271 [Helianthus annuus]